MPNECQSAPSVGEINAFGLSHRELQVLRLGREGATDKEIADAMGITVATLRTYWTRLRDKLGAVNRTQALVLSVASDSAPSSSNIRERLVNGLARERVSTWVWRGRSRQAYLDGVGAALFGLVPTDKPIPADHLLAHTWAPDRARFERFLFQGAELRALTPIEIRAGVPGDYCNLIRTANLASEGGSDPSLLLVSTTLHVFK